MSKALIEFFKFVASLLRRIVTSSDKNISQTTKAEITETLKDSIKIVQRDSDKIEEQLRILRGIDRQLTEAGEPRRGAAQALTQLTKDSSIDEILQDLARRAGTTPDQARTALVNRANEAYPPGDPKRMRFDDDETLQAYARVKIQMGEGDELLRDVIDAGAKDEMMKKLSMSPDEFNKMIGPGRPRSIYDEIAEDEMLPFGRSGEADDFGRPPSVQKRMDEMLEEGQKKVDKVEEYKKIFEGKMPKKNLGLTDEEIKFLRGDLDETEDLVEAQKAINQQKRDQKAVEDLMADPKNFGKSLDELMQMVQDAKIIPFKPKKAEGGIINVGRVNAQGGGLGFLLKMLGMKAPDKIADLKQMKNVIRDEKTDLTRLPSTPKNKPTIDEIEQMVMDDPRYKGRTQSEMMMKIDKEKIRAELAYNMEIDPNDIPDDMVDMLYAEGYHLKFATGGAVGVESLFKRKR